MQLELQSRKIDFKLQTIEINFFLRYATENNAAFRNFVDTYQSNIPSFTFS